MSELNLIWRKYGLRDNPYFNQPLSIDGSQIPITSFVGRENEKSELKKIISMGSDVRCMIIGDPGVGKTSLVNFVRAEATKSQFFTPLREIELNRIMSGNELIILTISSIYDEVKRQNISLESELREKLDALYELSKYGDLSYDISNLTTLNRDRLIQLFNELVDSIVNPRFNGILIHYDNLDNIEEPDDLIRMISDKQRFQN